MAKLLKRLNPSISAYKDRRFEGDDEDWGRALVTSTTLYIGNLSFYTREEQIYEVFSKAGHVERVIMGLDKHNKTPCGFAFVVYCTRGEGEAGVRYLNGTVLDERVVRVDHDWGFVEGRQWGRGRSGGQVRDEFRLDFDPGRGGFGKVLQQEMTTQFGGPGSSPMGLPMPDSKRQRTDRPERREFRVRGGDGDRQGRGNEGQGQGRAPRQAVVVEPMQEAAQHVDQDHAAAAARAAVEDNPRLRDRGRGDSDDDDR